VRVIAINVADLKDPSDPQGRSYRQVNAAKSHKIPLGTLVELEDGERLYVVFHHRDCDKTPLYGLALKDWNDEPNELIRRAKLNAGFDESNLTVVRVPGKHIGK
jgi:hypothetical protein